MPSRRVVIIDYGSGNLRSVAKAFEYVADAQDAIIVTPDPAELAKATHIVLPGVGAYADCMRGLRAITGMIEAMQERCVVRDTPFLGICVGMQMLLERGFEHGEHAGLGWIKGEVVPLAPADASLKIPHMGWNELRVKAPAHKLLEGIENRAHAYFVHSYHARCAHVKDVLAVSEYGGEIAAVIGRGNIMGTQFHPEKSQSAGLKLLQNFLSA